MGKFRTGRKINGFSWRGLNLCIGAGVFSFFLMLMAGCGKSKTSIKITSASDLNAKQYVIGGESGTIALRETMKKLPNATFQEYSNPGDIYTALSNGKIHAMTYDRPPLEYAAAKRDDWVVLPDELAVGRISVGSSLKNQELIEKVNRFIRQYRNDGTYKDMYTRWIKSKNTEMPDISAPKSPDGNIVIGIECTNEPMGFLGKDGKPVGFDIEFSLRLAKFLNRRCEFKVMNYEALFPACESGKIDLAAAQMDVTPERLETMSFSEPYIDSPVALMIRKTDYAGNPAISVVDALNRKGMRIGVPQSATATTLGEKLFPQAELLYFTVIPDGYAAVQYRKIDAFLFDRHCMEHAVKDKEDMALLPEDIGEEKIAIGFPKSHAQLRDQVNEFIQKSRNDGTYQEMYNRWIRTGTTPQMPDIPKPVHPVKKYKIGTDGMNEPMNFYGKDGKLTGFDLEFIRRLALYLNADIEIVTMRYDGLLPAVISGKVDMLVANMNVTPERQEKLLLSDNYIDSSVAVMVRTDHVLFAGAKGEIRSLADLKGKRAASLTGAGFQQLTEPLQPGIEYLFFNDNNSSVQALRAGKADAVLLDEPVAQLHASQFSDELIFAGIYAEDHYGYAFAKGSPLARQASEVIRELKRSGEIQRLIDKWCKGKASAKKLGNWTHRKEWSGKNGTLRFASDPVLEPMCFIDENGKATGLDVELVHRIAYELDMRFEFVSMNFGSLVEAVNAGKADVVGGAMSITDERKKKIDFAECYYDGGLSILTKRIRKLEPGANSSGKIARITDLNDARFTIGGITGPIAFDSAKKQLSNAKFAVYPFPPDLYIALIHGQIDAAVFDRPALEYAALTHENLTVLPGRISDQHIVVGGAPRNKEWMERINGFIRQYRKDGTYREMYNRWILQKGATMPDIPSPENPEGPTLIIGVDPTNEPMNFLTRDGKNSGFDIEFVKRMALALNINYKIKMMNRDDLFPACESGKIDLAVSQLEVTPERMDKMLFSEKYIDCPCAVMIRTEDFAAAPANARESSACSKFWSELKSSFERTFLRESRWKLILQGLEVTVLITIFAAIFGTILAFPICFMRRSKVWIWSSLGKTYVSLMQGTPILVILMILYYIIFAKIDIDAVWVAIIGFGLNFAAYVSEMLRTGIDGIPKGQSEAALALGFSRYAVFRKVILPQAVRSILPVYRGEFINVLKTTSIVGYIAIQDLTKMSDIIRSRTYEAFFPLIATAIIYFVTAWLLAFGLSLIDYRLDPNNRRKRRKGGAK